MLDEARKFDIVKFPEDQDTINNIYNNDSTY